MKNAARTQYVIVNIINGQFYNFGHSRTNFTKSLSRAKRFDAQIDAKYELDHARLDAPRGVCVIKRVRVTMWILSGPVVR